MEPQTSIIKKICDTIIDNNSFLILLHNGPDGDCICSALALALVLKKLKKQVITLSRDTLPQVYQMFSDTKLITWEQPLKEKRFDVGIILEFGSRKRVDEYYKDYIDHCKIKINIDHHLSNDKFGDINYVDKNAAAVAIQIYKVLKGLKIRITKRIAEYLYIAIMTDTGNFKFTNTNYECLKVASELVKLGVNPSYLYQKIYGAKSINLLKLTALATYNTIIENNFAYVSINKKMFNKFNMKDIEAREVLDNILLINGIKLAILFKEHNDNEIKISFRSNDKKIDVNKLANKFSGGGHKQAAGCILKGKLEEVKDKVLKEVKKLFNSNFHSHNSN